MTVYVLAGTSSLYVAECHQRVYTGQCSDRNLANVGWLYHGCLFCPVLCVALFLVFRQLALISSSAIVITL